MNWPMFYLSESSANITMCRPHLSLTCPKPAARTWRFTLFPYLKFRFYDHPNSYLSEQSRNHKGECSLFFYISTQLLEKMYYLAQGF